MKAFVAILMGLYSASLIVDIIGLLFGSANGRLLMPIPIKVVVFILAAAVGARWLVRNATSWRRLLFNGCTLGAIEWIVTIACIWIYQHRVVSALASSGLSKGELQSQGISAGVSSGLEIMIALFSLGVCIVGLLLTKNARHTTTIPKAGAGKAAVPGPRLVTTVCIVAAEVIIGIFCITESKRGSSGLSGILDAIVVVAAMGLLVIVAIAGFVQGLRLLKARRHRVLGVTAVIVSAVPLLFAAIELVESQFALAKLDARNSERRAQYREMAPLSRSPQLFARSYAAGDEIVLVFANDLEVHMPASDSEGLSSFCNEFFVGKKLEVLMPEEDRFLSDPTVNVVYEGTNLEMYSEGIMQADQYGQAYLDRVAMLAVRRNALPSAPDAKEIAQVARKLRAFADTDGSGSLDHDEGMAFGRLLEFGFDAYDLASRGFGRSRIARDTGVAPRDLDERARKYESMTDRIEQAGIVDLPELILPEEDDD